MHNRENTFSGRTGLILLAGLIECLAAMVAVGCEENSHVIRVETQPVEADIHLNNRRIGRSPCPCKIADTKPDDLWEIHVLEARANGYEPARQEILYRSGAPWLPEKVSLTLRRKDGYLDLQEPPADVEPPTPGAPAGPATKPTPPSAKQTTSPGLVSLVPETPTGRRIACEMRIVRLADGRVMGQVSLMGPCDQSGRLAETMIELLADRAPDDGPIAMASLCNRRKDRPGRQVAEDMTNRIVRILEQTDEFSFDRYVNLRNVILIEEMMEVADVVAHKRIAHMFGPARYVIIGGVAQEIPLRNMP